jgi:hypothetical protein
VAVMKGGIKQSIRNHVASLVFGFAPVKHTMANLLSEVDIAYSRRCSRKLSQPGSDKRSR